MADGTGGVREVRHTYVPDSSQTQSGSNVENFKGSLTPKEGMGDKFSKENMAKVGEGIQKGTIKCLKKTAAYTLVALSVITPKKQSNAMANKAVEMMVPNSDVHVNNYGQYKRDKITSQAQKMWGSTVKSLGMGMMHTSDAIQNHSKEGGKLWKFGESVGHGGSSLSMYGFEQKDSAKADLKNLDKPYQIKFSSLPDEDKEIVGASILNCIRGTATSDDEKIVGAYHFSSSDLKYSDLADNDKLALAALRNEQVSGAKLSSAQEQIIKAFFGNTL